MTDIGEEQEVDAMEDGGTGGESDRKRLGSKQNPQAMRSRHKSSIFQVDGALNSSNEVSNNGNQLY